ncbi:MAG: cytochrome c biogenesis protein ResB [Planctomycetota bacterium]|nr:cytochrome c biogenesis protein ResB [Planctomycetota bacterium]
MRFGVDRGLRILGSFGLALVLLGLLWILTLVGTFEQARMSLYAVQEQIFGSAFFVYDLGGVPIPLPGAYLVLALLFVNLLVGGMLRLRKGSSTWGILVTHVGIAMLLVGGFVEERWSTKGRLTLHEGDSAAQFVSFYEWEVVVAELRDDDSAREYVVPHSAFADLGDGGTHRARHAELPFELVLSGYHRNCDIRRASGEDGIDGYTLTPRAPEAKAEMDIAGLRVDLEVAGEAAPRRALLWALQGGPYQTVVEGRRFEVDLRRRSYELPFRVHLRRFERAMHPGTGMASRFSSYVSRVQDGVLVDAHITMNEPMRHAGFTIYQTGWGPEGAGPGERLFSTFSVVENPSDRLPIVACVVIAVGLLWHFGRRLRLHLGAQARRASGAAA